MWHASYIELFGEDLHHQMGFEELEHSTVHRLAANLPVKALKRRYQER